VGGLIEGTMAAAKDAGVRDTEEVRQCQHRVGRMTTESRDINGQIKQLLTRRLYSLDRLTQEREIASKKIGELFELLIAMPERLPLGYREQLPEQPIARVVCDYIAGMTDAYFLRIYNELVGN
jgi:dGTPase